MSDALLFRVDDGYTGARALYSAPAQKWEEASRTYDSVVAAHARDKLQVLDRWYWHELPAAVLSRDRPHITLDELTKLLDWKHTRGTWRPNARHLKGVTAQGVHDASAAAFAALGVGSGGASAASKVAPNMDKVAEAVEALTGSRSKKGPYPGLKGVGPATASAVLAAVDPSICYMEDDALMAVFDERVYKLPQLLQLIETLRAKAQELTTATGRVWTAAEVERLLWCADLPSKPKPKTKTKPAAMAPAAKRHKTET